MRAGTDEDKDVDTAEQEESSLLESVLRASTLSNQSPPQYKPPLRVINAEVGTGDRIFKCMFCRSVSFADTEL